jgi:cysteine desulfurase
MSTYLDYNATTPLDPRVKEAMQPYWEGVFGNPSSGHEFGRAARTAVDSARQQVADLVGAHPSQVVFTSGGTEANNLAIKGFLQTETAALRGPGLVALSAVEHPSVREPAKSLTGQGWTLAEIPVDATGRLAEGDLDEVLQRKPSLVAMMMANNETGVLFPVSRVAEKVRAAGAVLFTDAVQAVGKLPVDFGQSGAHLMTLSAHKIYGPKGAGALIVDKALDMGAISHGGGQEQGRRAGTENVAAIVGFGQAAELAKAELEQRRLKLAALHERFERQLTEAVPQCRIFGQGAERLPTTTFLSVPGVDGETLLMTMDQAGYAVSSGSACGTGEVEPSHVLTAMGIEASLAKGAIRVSLGKDSSEEAVEGFVRRLKEQLQTFQRMGALACA